MKCYYHNQAEAVSFCKNCQKSLCKSCYDQGRNGRCLECEQHHRQNIIQEEKTNNRRTNFYYIKGSILSLIVGLVIGFLLSRYFITFENFNNEKLEISQITYELFVTLLFGFYGFSLYCGIKILLRIMKRVLNFGFLLIFTWPLLIALLLLAAIIGILASIPMFVVYCIRYIRGKKIIIDTLSSSSFT